MDSLFLISFSSAVEEEEIVRSRKVSDVGDAEGVLL